MVKIVVLYGTTAPTWSDRSKCFGEIRWHHLQEGKFLARISHEDGCGTQVSEIASASGDEWHAARCSVYTPVVPWILAFLENVEEYSFRICGCTLHIYTAVRHGGIKSCVSGAGRFIWRMRTRGMSKHHRCPNRNFELQKITFIELPYYLAQWSKIC